MIDLVYVPFDVQRLTDEVVLDFQIASNSFAIWNMEINQIECGHKAALVTTDEREGLFSFSNFLFCSVYDVIAFILLINLAAPDGCLQYFHQTSGVVESFNFGRHYYGNTHYAICFNRNYNENAILE